jgi:hypothetical protein
VYSRPCLKGKCPIKQALSLLTRFVSFIGLLEFDLGLAVCSASLVNRYNGDVEGSNDQSITSRSEDVD